VREKALHRMLLVGVRGVLMDLPRQKDARTPVRCSGCPSRSRKETTFTDDERPNFPIQGARETISSTNLAAPRSALAPIVSTGCIASPLLELL
jgi:hypothetical protein